MFARLLRLVGVYLLLLAGCDSSTTTNTTRPSDLRLPDPVAFDFEQIQERDTLVVLTTYNSTSYFLYRGQPMGYEFELLRAFAEEHDLALKMRVVSSRDSIFVMLNEGRGDIVADRVMPAADDTARIAFTEAIYVTHPVLVQREDPTREAGLPTAVDTVVQEGAPPGADEPITDIAEGGEADTVPARPQIQSDLPSYVEVRARLVQRPQDLEGEQVALAQRSPYFDTIIELSDTLTGDVHIVELEEVISDENVIRHVAAGEVNYTVTSDNLARLSSEQFTNLRVQPVMGPRHRVTWAVRINAPELRERLNDWILDKRDEALFNNLYRKYFVDRQGYRERVESKYLTSETGVLSDYDPLFKRYAPALGWDWRLLAAQCYQESRFKPQARSWAGAAGLLQLMPPTAREFGVSDVYDPDENVAGAVRFLQWLTEYWRPFIPDSTERMKFILASYNTGHGHVEDARRLTAKNGGDDTKWADVAYWLLQKSKAEVYRDPVVKYGYSRGLEPVMYVSHILDRFEHYREFVVTPATPEPTAASP